MLKERVLEVLKERRENLLSGKINSIPSPLVRFRNDFVGIEQGKYYLVTAGTKVGKSQFASYMFIYNTVLFAYNNPGKVKLKIFYYPLEETPEGILERFMSYLLYLRTEKAVRVAPIDLRSTDNNRPLSENILNLMEEGEFSKILQFFEECVVFSSSTNPTGIWKECKTYAESSGEVFTKKISITDEFTGNLKEIDAFDYYVPNDPLEYKLIFIDHIGLISPERGMDLRQSINKLSEYLVSLRNRYKFSPVVIQQQAFFETTDAFKLDKLRPTVTNLGDSKYPARDCNICLSLFSPYKYELREYLGYDITKLKDSIRFLEVLINRDGQSNGIIALYFDGAVNYFQEMPPANSKEGINAVYRYLETLKTTAKHCFMMVSKKINYYIAK